jgi:hypothetical protein
MIAESTACRRESGVGRPDLFELVVRPISLAYVFPLTLKPSVIEVLPERRETFLVPRPV